MARPDASVSLSALARLGFVELTAASAALSELAGIRDFDAYWCEGKPPANPIYIDKW